MTPELELRAIWKLGRGRTHLTASPEGAAALTLCGRSFRAEEATPSDRAADCRLCQRRGQDPARVSAAFFAAGRGSEVLERSLDRVSTRPARTPGPRPAPAPVRPARPRAAPPEPLPQTGELDRDGLAAMGDLVWTSPGGVVIRQLRSDPGRVAQISGPAGAGVRRSGAGKLEIRLGDVLIEVCRAGGDLGLRVSRLP